MFCSIRSGLVVPIIANTFIANPYVYDIGSLTGEGENHLRVETGTTLTNVAVDGFSMDRPVTPQGIFGPVLISVDI